MATIGVYDWDFMHYENVIPNLECAKLCTYFHNRHEIAVLTPMLTPAPYTQYYIRKDYNDGLYPKRLFLNNCIYGGRAFNPDHYSPLAQEIERTIPNMHIYDKFKDKFGHTQMSQRTIRHILNCAHIRLSTNETEAKSLNQLLRITATGRYTGIIFHDYNLAQTPGAFEIINELSRTRHFVTKEGINPYAIGNKFPIQVSSSAELEKWLGIVSMPDLFCLQYNGVMDDEVMYALCTENRRMARQIYYKIDEPWYGENHFLEKVLPKILTQVAFLRRQGIKILLKYSYDKVLTQELQNVIDVLNCWLRFSYVEEFAQAQTLYVLCREKKKFDYWDWRFRNVTLDIDTLRDTFQWVRENNYELFKMFYEVNKVELIGGEFQNVGGTNPK